MQGSRRGVGGHTAIQWASDPLTAGAVIEGCHEIPQVDTEAYAGVGL